jgi:hypothetical protein
MALVMDGYDPLAMPYGNSPMPFPAGNMQNLDYMSVPSVMDLQDQYSNFDSEPYMRCAKYASQSHVFHTNGRAVMTWASRPRRASSRKP